MRKLFILMCMCFIGNLMSLTLDDAVKLALEKNITHKSKVEQRDSAIADYKSYKVNLYPQFKLKGAYGIEKNSPEAGLELAISKKALNFSTSLDVSQILFSAGVFNGLQAAKVYTATQDESVNLSVENTIYDTHVKFYSVLLAEDVYNINKDAVEVATKHYNHINDMYIKGLASEYDMLRAELEVENLKPDLAKAEREHELAVKDLMVHLGLEDAPELEGMIIAPSETLPDIDQAINDGMNDRIELKMSALNVDINKIVYRNEKMSFLPQFFLSASLKHVHSNDKFEYDSDFTSKGFTAGIAFEMPIFTGQSNLFKTRKSMHDYKIARLEDDLAKKNIEIEIRNYRMSVEENRKSLEASIKGLALAEKGLTIAESRYNNKLGTILEILDAQLSLKKAKLNKSLSEYNLLISLEGFKKSIGRKL